MSEFLKSFFKHKLTNRVSIDTETEVFKQWVLKLEIQKYLNKDRELLEKSRRALDALINNQKPDSDDMNSYLNLRKKYKLFRLNNQDLINPSAKDVLSMDSLTFDEVDEMIGDSHRILNNRYYNSIVEIFRSSRNGEIISPTSGGLRRPTPTNDYIDNEVDSYYNPADDYVD